MNDHEEDHSRALAQTGFWGKQAAGAILFSRTTRRFGLTLRSGEVLEPHTYGTVGGAIDGNEDPKRAVVREIAEELGIRLDASARMELLNVFQSGTFKYTTFLISIGDEIPESHMHFNWENDGFEWFSLDEVPQPLHPGVAKMFSNPQVRQKLETLVGIVEEFELITENGIRITRSDLDTAASLVNRFYKQIGINVVFASGHFIEQCNSLRNNPMVRWQEIKSAFQRLFAQHQPELRAFANAAYKNSETIEAVLVDLQTDLNIPFVLEWKPDRQEIQVRPKTIMRKKDFQTPNQKIFVEDANSDAEQFARAEDVYEALGKFLYDADEEGVIRGYLRPAKYDSVDCWIFKHNELLKLNDITTYEIIRDLMIIFGPKNYEVPAFYTPKNRKNGGKGFIMLNIAPNATPDGIGKAFATIISRKHFMHEFIHFLDDQKYDMSSVGSAPKPSDGPVKYYNDPAEYNAYFNGIADHLLASLTLLKKEPSEYSIVLDIYGIDPDFTKTVAKILDKRFGDFKRFLTHMNPERKKAAIRRLYKIHKAIFDIIREQTKGKPVEESEAEWDTRLAMQEVAPEPRTKGFQGAASPYVYYAVTPTEAREIARTGLLEGSASDRRRNQPGCISLAVRKRDIREDHASVGKINVLDQQGRVRCTLDQYQRSS